MTYQVERNDGTHAGLQERTLVSLTWSDGWLDTARSDGQDADAISQEYAQAIGRINAAEERYLRCDPAARAKADEEMGDCCDWEDYPAWAQDLAELAELYESMRTQKEG